MDPKRTLLTGQNRRSSPRLKTGTSDNTQAVAGTKTTSDSTRTTSDSTRTTSVTTRALTHTIRSAADITRTTSDTTRAGTTGIARCIPVTAPDTTRTTSNITMTTSDTIRKISAASTAIADTTKAMTDTTKVTVDHTREINPEENYQNWLKQSNQSNATSSAVENEVTGITSSQDTKSLPVINVLQTPERQKSKSRTTTPSSSSVQRELKKIEDYWTRQNPVKSDSPRLRCHKRKDDGTKSSDQQQIDNNVDTFVGSIHHVYDDEFLPESPIPVSKTPQISNSLNAHENHSEDFHSVGTRRLSEEKYKSMSTGGNDSEGDEEYMPARKKLRSEVKEDELWEGIPLTISFKRLTPLCRVSNDRDQRFDTPKAFTNNDATKPDESLFSGKKKETFDSFQTKNTSKHPARNDTSAVQMVQDSVRSGNLGTNSEKQELMHRNVFEHIENAYAKPESSIKPCVKTVKRSARLKLRNSRTQGSSQDVSQNQPKPLSTKFNSSDEKCNIVCDQKQMNINCVSKQLDCDLTVNEELIRLPILPEGINSECGASEKSDTKDPSEKIKCDENIHETAKRDGSISERMIDEDGNVTEKSLHDNDCIRACNNFSSNGDVLQNQVSFHSAKDTCKRDTSLKLELKDIANMSISQILSCDSQNSLPDDVPEVGDTVDIDLENTVIYNESENLNTDCDIYVNTKSPVHESASESTIPSELDKEKFGMHSKPTEENLESEINSLITNNSIDKMEDNKDLTCDKSKQIREISPFTLIKEGKQNKNKKVPPLKIKLKSLSKSSKSWKIKTKKEVKKANVSEVVPNDAKTTVDNAEEVSTLSESSGKKTTKKSKSLHKTKQGKQNTPECSNKAKKSKRSEPKKESKRKQRIWSPPSNMNLRLNSERRLSMVNGLLSNKVLNNHACVIWSSENRRHMHLSHPDAAAAELDDLLREKWTQLCEKEKIRYLQRAWHASKDENKHSTRRQALFEVKEKQTGNPSIERFLALDSKTQHVEIKQWLQFYYEVSLETYTTVINQFRESLQSEKQEREKTDKESKTKKRKKKYKKHKQNNNEIDTDAKHRRLMFEAILNNRQEILETWAERKETQAQTLRDNFDSLILKLVTGVEVELTRNVKSTRLTQTLQDLCELEKDKKLMVSGDGNDGSSYATLLNEVDEYLKERNTTSSLLDSLEDDCVNHDKVEEYLRGTNKMDEHKMPILNAVAIKQVLDGVTNTKRRKNLSIYKKQVTLSPPSMLTEWVAEDIVRVHPNIAFRSAVSLLSGNKIRPNATFLSTTPAEHAVAQSGPSRKMQSILAGNSNQNCYRTVTYTFPRDRSSTCDRNPRPIISQYNGCIRGYDVGVGYNR